MKAMRLTNSTQTSDVASQYLAKTASERSQLYGLLAAVFRWEPEAGLLDQIKSPALAQALSDCQIDPGLDFFGKAGKNPVEELAIEYTRLFCGPGHHISPHESVQLKRGSGTLWGEETVVVKRTIEAAGFDYDQYFNGIPDHVSVELEYLAKLVSVEANCWRTENYTDAENALGWQHQFIAKHVGKWIPVFCRKVKDQAQMPFYAAFASLLRQFIAGEKAEITDRRKKACRNQQTVSPQIVTGTQL